MNEEKYEQVKRSKKEIFLNNIIGGIAWGIGVTIGLTLLIALLGFLANQINLVPVVGGFISEVIKFIISKNSNITSMLPFLFSQYAYA